MIPSHPLFRRFKDKFRVPIEDEERVLEWHAEKGNVFFRPIEEDTRFLWAALDIFGRKSGRKVWHDAIEHNQLLRAFFVQHGEAVFLREQDAIVHIEGASIGAQFHLADRWKQSLFSPQKRLEQIVNLQSEDPGSDLNAARRWLEGDSKWQSEWQVRDRNGCSPEEVWNILKAFSFVFELHGQEYVYFRGAPRNPRVSIAIACKDESAHVLTTQFLNRVFSLEIQQRRCVRGYSGWLESWTTGSRALSFDEPTQHERLEAFMVWRNFLRDNVPPEEIEALLKV
jgi:hypothetical protein